MARPRLAVWMYDTRVADIEARGPLELRLRYAREALARWPINTPLLSCSLPVSRAWQPASAYLRGLLPEGRHLQAAASSADLATSDTYGLLRRYGRDVAGALVITLHDEVPDDSRWGAEPYTKASLARLLGAMDDDGNTIQPDSELSIAGLQNKLLLVRVGDRWARPTGGKPSTHILKVDDAQRPGLIAAEFAALSIGREIGVAQGTAELRTIAGRRCMIVERFDRKSKAGAEISRIHQEDSCQALGINHEANRGRGKYQAAGGPSLRQIATLLATHATDPGRELVALAAQVVFTAAIGNADAHGKNIALLHHESGRVSLAPAYDTVPTMLWMSLRTTAGMSIGGCADIVKVKRRHLLDEFVAWGMPAGAADAVVEHTIGAILEARVRHSDLKLLVRSNIDRMVRAPRPR